MGKINQTTFEPSDVPTATQLNQPYTELGSLNVQEYNTGNDWALRSHFDSSVASKINSTYGNSIQVPQTVNTTTWFTLGSVVFTELAVNNEVLRVSWDTLVSEIVYGGGITNADINYAFRVLVATSGGTNYFIAPGVYSIVARSVPTAQPALNTLPIQWRSCAGAQCWMIPAGTTVTSVQLQAKVCAVPNEITVDRLNLNVVVGRR